MHFTIAGLVCTTNTFSECKRRIQDWSFWDSCSSYVCSYLGCWFAFTLYSRVHGMKLLHTYMYLVPQCCCVNTSRIKRQGSAGPAGNVRQGPITYHIFIRVEEQPYLPWIDKNSELAKNYLFLYHKVILVTKSQTTSHIRQQNKYLSSVQNSAFTKIYIVTGK